MASTDLIYKLYLPRIEEAASAQAREAIEQESLQRCRASIKRVLLDRDQHIFLAMDQDTQQIAGFSTWIVPEDLPGSRLQNKRSMSWTSRVHFLLLKIWDKLASLLIPRGFGFLLGYSHLARVTLQRQLDWAGFVAAADARHVPTHHAREGFWRLSLCGVLPQFGRQGIGQRLLAWGFEQADEDHRVVYISASAQGKGAYEKAGAREIGRDICYPEDRLQGGWAEIVCRREKQGERKRAIVKKSNDIYAM